MAVHNLIGQLPVHPHKRWPERDPRAVKRVVIHHTGASATQAWRDIALYHVRSDQVMKGGAPGIAYHYGINPDGGVYKFWPMGTVVACVRFGNTPSLCVVVKGNYEISPLPQAAWKSLVALTRALCRGYGIKEVWGHGELMATACPGKHIDLARLRKEVLG